MAWRVSNVEPHLPHRDRVARAKCSRAGAAQALPDSRIVSCSREEQRGTDASGKRFCAREEIGVQMSLRDERDPYVVERSGLEVRLGIPEWIDDDRLARGLAGEDIARLGETVVVEAPEYHRVSLLGRFLVTVTARG
jgi:hypothetical protein